MMTKLFLSFTICLGYIASFATPLWSDQPLPLFTFTLTGVKVTAVDRKKTDDGKVSDEVSDTLKHWIRFDVKPSFDKKASQSFSIEDPVDKFETKMTFDKPIKFEGEEVPAGTNLLKFKKFNGKSYNISAPGLIPGGTRSVRIKRGFEIPADDYEVNFEWTTESGKKFSSKVKVNIDVKLPPGEPEKRKPQTT